ncbi:hypothetical protein ARMGADRAFT_575215 [Armillaria gallica]|uniref:Uncharacterized protein n=1 Tax=Armillaria gallica TaxID=47427 RepID=A0A2H3DT31_ARMGA|nr:hypothetical protein ARMGADRAFT_575215 [Armillaria gallica]
MTSGRSGIGHFVFFLRLPKSRKSSISWIGALQALSGVLLEHLVAPVAGVLSTDPGFDSTRVIPGSINSYITCFYSSSEVLTCPQTFIEPLSSVTCRFHRLKRPLPHASQFGEQS